MITYFLLGIAYGFLAGVQPGPLQAYVIAQTLQRGWRHTIYYALVPIMSDLPIIALVLLILTQVPAQFLLVIRFVGGFFLLYLAANVVRSIQRLREETGTGGVGVGLLKAVLINFLNPNPYLYWGLISGPVLLAGWRQAPVNGIALLVGFYLTIIIVTAAIILIVGVTRRLPLIVRQGLLAVSAFGLVFFGIYQIWMGINQLLGKTSGSI